MRKVIPDALPRVLDGRVSAEDMMEMASNRKELEQVEKEAAHKMECDNHLEQYKNKPSKYEKVKG